MPGFSTPVWGPPLWRILHSVAFAMSPKVGASLETDATIVGESMTPELANYVAMWVMDLGYVMPCSYCRTSFREFWKDLELEVGPLPSVIVNNNFDRWMYVLHEKVNDKLDFQFFEQDVRGRRFTFECIERRYRMRPVQFTEEDVWDVLSIFALNTEASMLEVNEELSEMANEQDPRFPAWFQKRQKVEKKVAKLAEFVLKLPRVLETCNVTLQFRSHFEPQDPFRWVCKERRRDEREMRAHYMQAAAQECSHGSCI